MASKSQYYAFIAPDESDEDNENLSDLSEKGDNRKDMSRLFDSTILMRGFFGFPHKIRGESKFKMQIMNKLKLFTI